MQNSQVAGVKSWSVLIAVGCVAISNPAEAKSFELRCDDGSTLQVSEVIKESSHRVYPLGDLIEIKIEASKPPLLSGTYRLLAAGTGSFGGRWVYPGPPGPDFSLLKSGRSDDWYVSGGWEGEAPIICTSP
jgi:hypothetical protein